MYSTLILSLACVLASIGLVVGHGSVHDPVARQTRWRYDKSGIANYDDNQLFCGGFYIQVANGGRCGLCGDNAANAIPRAHELGGKYGQGTIVKNYQSGGPLAVRVQLTANHKGYFLFDLCNLDGSAENEECFEKTKLLLTTGEDRYTLTSTQAGVFNVNLQIPPNLHCSHCVLRWTYVCGNNWGICSNGSGAVGCGPQENFRACSDISIN